MSIFWESLRHEVRGFTRDGTEIEPTRLPPPSYETMSAREFARVAITLALVRAAGAVPPSGRIHVSSADSARIMNRLVSRLDAPPRQLANLLPRYVDFRCSPNGTQWLRPLDAEVGGLRGGPVWLRISPDGETRRIGFPDRIDPYRFTSAKIWGVQRDEFNVASVAWIAASGAR